MSIRLGGRKNLGNTSGITQVLWAGDKSSPRPASGAGGKIYPLPLLWDTKVILALLPGAELAVGGGSRDSGAGVFRPRMLAIPTPHFRTHLRIDFIPEMMQVGH